MKHDFFTSEPIIFTLQSGMTVHLIQDDSKSIYVDLTVKFGSFDTEYRKNNENYKITSGIAHFLEHKMFTMEEGDALSYLNQLGISANAMTSYTETSYVISGISNMLEGTSYLLKMLDNVFLTEENVESEKQIIGDEINMYLDDTDTRIYSELFKQLYWYHPVREDIGGTIESVYATTKEELERLHHEFYRHQHRILVISGPIDVEAFKAMLHEYDKALKPNEYDLLMLHEQEPYEVLLTHQILPLDVVMEKVAIGFKLVHSHHHILDDIIASFALNMLYGETTDFYESLVKKGLLSHHFTYQIISEEDCFSCLIIASTKSNTQLHQALMERLMLFDEQDLSDDQFEYFKKAYIGNYVMSLNDFEFKNYYYRKLYTRGHTLSSLLTLIENIDKKDIFDFIYALKNAPRSDLFIEIKS